MTSPTDGLLIRDVELDGARVDCRVLGGTVSEVAPGLSPRDGEVVVEGRGGAILPGLHDHHVHALAAAAALGSIDLAGEPLPREVPETPGDGWVRLVGLGDDDVTAAELDRLWGDRPVRAQHRSGALWVLNSVAVALLGEVLDAEERATGRVWRPGPRLDEALREHDARDVPACLGEWGAALARAGVTGVTDATPGLTRDAAALVRSVLPQRVATLGADPDTMPVKIVAPDHVEDLWGHLVGRVAQARSQGRAVALHSVSATSLAVLLGVLDELGARPGDRVEHAAVCDDDAADRLAALGLTVVTQPTIAHRRGPAMAEQSEPADRPWLWRMRGLAQRGVPVVLSSDAPYGDADPWRTIRVAADLAAGSLWSADERLAPRQALRSFLTAPDDPAGPVRTVAPGSRADLCVLEAGLDDVLSAVVDGTTTAPVVATVVAGRLVSTRRG